MQRITCIFLRSFILFVVFSITQFASAADYYWKITHLNAGNLPTNAFTSASSACDAAKEAFIANYSYNPIHIDNYVVTVDGATVSCAGVAKRNSDNGGIGNLQAYGQRYGDACPSGATYNPATGKCDPPPEPCLAKAGQSFNYFVKLPPPMTNLPGEFVCQDSCRATAGGQCAAHNDGTHSACWGVATYNGSPCSPGDTLNGAPPPADPPDSTEPPAYCGPNYAWSGTTCVPKPPPPPCDPSTGEVCPPPDPEPSCDPATQTCPPPDPEPPCDPATQACPPPDPEPPCDPATQTCPPPDPEPPCDPATQTCPPPDECDPATDPDKCLPKPSKVTGDECDATLVCEGDAIQCAILKQQKKQTCDWDYAKAKPAIEAAIVENEYKLTEKESDMSGLFSAGTGASRFLPSSCPASESVNVMGFSYSLSWEPLCKFASGLSFIIVAMASVFFAVYVGRSFGGS